MGCSLQVPHTFFVISGLNSNVIFGCDFMKVTSSRLDLKNSTASFFDDSLAGFATAS